MISGQGGREPHVVIHLNIEGGSEGMRERGMRMVKVSEVGGVDRSARKEGWWERRESLSRILEQRGSRMAVTTDEISTEASRLDDLVRATFAVGELGNGAGSSVAVDLDLSHD
jgi:hypothetical protein